MKRSDVEVIDEQTVYAGFADIVKYHVRHRLFSGEWSPVFEREIYTRADAVGVLIYDPHQEAIAFVEQFRPGAMGREFSPWSLELVAGLIESGETLESVVIREAKEEAGVTISPENVHYLFDYLSSPGGSSERVYIYYAEAAISKSLQTFGLAEESEDIKLHVVPVKEAIQWCREGRIKNAMTLLAIQQFALGWINKG